MSTNVTSYPAEPADATVQALSGDKIISEAKARLDRGLEWEGTSRIRFLNDIKFENGDSDNGYQWPNVYRMARDADNRPCLTMNIIRQHNLQISNDARKNKASIRVIGTGNGATEKSANVFRDVIRNIETRSRAQSAYTVARGFQIGGGIGYWRVNTDYVSETSFDQEAVILPINDPLSVVLDPNIKMKDGSDAEWGIIFVDIPKDEFDAMYPEYKDQVSQQPLGTGTLGDWILKDKVRVAEYYRKVKKKEKLYSFVQAGERKFIREGLLPDNVRKALEVDPMTRTRDTWISSVEWYLIAGEKIIDQTEWLGKYIPIVRVIGEETVIEGVLDRKGHTRSMKDAQRMYNYNASSQVEFVGLQGKTPWLASVKAIEEYESMWNTANTANHSVLIWNSRDDDGNEIPAPTRTNPPTASAAYQAGMDTAFNQMMMVSGQWQNQMGMGGNERTGKAISLRQAQSETAVFHFQDNYEEALQFTGRILIDLIPKIYDTKRVLQILADDGTTVEVEVNPSAKQAYMLQAAENEKAVKTIFNPNIGTYDVAPSVGPMYGSKREQTVDAITLILTQSPALTPIIGDLLLDSMDFEKAQEAARRLRRMVPPAALGEGPSPQEQELGGRIEALTRALSESLSKQGKTELKLIGANNSAEVDEYNAETKRIEAMKEFLAMDPGGVQELIQQLVNQALANSLGVEGEIEQAEPDENDLLPEDLEPEEMAPEEELGEEEEFVPPVGLAPEEEEEVL